jgi:PAS domain S-box-containing protein
MAEIAVSLARSAEARIADLEVRLACAEKIACSDHPYREFVESMDEGVVAFDSQGLIAYSNQQFALMMKTCVEQVIGSRITDFVADDQWETLVTRFQADHMSHCHTQLNLRAADGTSVPAQVSLNRLDMVSTVTICATIIDLTDTGVSEAVIKEEQLSRLILDHAAEAIVVIDVHGRIVRASESAGRVAGCPVLLQNFDSVFQLWKETASVKREPSGRFDTVRLLSAVTLRGAVRGEEVTLVRSNGSSCALLLSATRLLDEANEASPCVVTLTDISERKRTEEALARQARELARSNNDLRQFAYSASHDLQEPLRILAIYSQLLQKKYHGRLDPEADQYIQFTVEAAHRMQDLVKGLLAYTQAGETARPPDAPVDADAALRKTLATLGASIMAHGGAVTHEPLPRLLVHEVHIQQLFHNLIGNALKYRSGAPPSIRIRAQPDPGTSGPRQSAWRMWRISVQDNGIGIEPEYQRDVFGLFKRLHGGRKYAGNGIGLAICQKIVECYGGRIWVESAPGQGSCFTFTLPAEATRGE